MRCFVLQCGMYPLCIVEIHIVLNAETQLRQTDIIFDFDVFVFQRPPAGCVWIYDTGYDVITSI